MTKREATRRLRELTKSDAAAQAVREANNREAREVTEEFFGIRGGDEVEVVDKSRRYCKGIVISVSGGHVMRGYQHFGTVTVQPYNQNGYGKKLTRSHEARRQFSIKGILKVTRTAEQVGPIGNIPRTGSR